MPAARAKWRPEEDAVLVDCAGPGLSDTQAGRKAALRLSGRTWNDCRHRIHSLRRRKPVREPLAVPAEIREAAAAVGLLVERHGDGTAEEFYLIRRGGEDLGSWVPATGSVHVAGQGLARAANWGEALALFPVCIACRHA